MNRRKATTELRTILQPGSTVYTEIVYVEAFRRQRDKHIKLYLLQDREPRSITAMAGCVIGSRMNESGDAIISVDPLRDAEFVVVANLSEALFPTGFGCIGKGCPSHEHTRGASNYGPHLHKDGRHALRTLGLKYRNEA
jgi:hypothetical protein